MDVVELCVSLLGEMFFHAFLVFVVAALAGEVSIVPSSPLLKISQVRVTGRM